MSSKRTAIGEFLRSRRAALTPEETRVPIVGSVRRVPGLRREEVAVLAGVSVNYYARIEQGEIQQMSRSVVEAIGRALRLDYSERLHLERLVLAAQQASDASGPETVRDSLVAMATSRTEEVAVVVGRRLDVLAGNPLLYALYGVPLNERFNLASLAFTGPCRTFWVDWEGNAREIAAYLRMATSETPNDPELAKLIHDLNRKSPDFARIWSAQHVAERTYAVHEFNHPRVGRITLHAESLCVPDAPGQRFNIMTAEPGSDSAIRLRQLIR